MMKLEDPPPSRGRAPGLHLQAGRTWVLAITMVLAMAVVVVPVLVDGTIVVPGHDWFIGADTYMRMVRVQDWWNAGDWYANTTQRSNWPYGETLHWTRPLDMMLVALAWPLMAFMNEARAFYWAGQFISPLLGLATMGGLVVASRGLLDLRGQIAMMFLIVIQPLSRYYFEPGRPDHHSLLLFLFVLAFALLSVLCRERHVKEKEFKTASLLGVAIGLAVWVSVEALTTAFFVYAFFGVAWLYRGADKGGAHWLLRLRATAWATLAMVTVALAVERPPSEWINAVEYDRISIVQWALFALAALASEGLFRTSPKTHTLRGRTFYALLAAAFVIGMMTALFPGFVQGPFSAAMEPRLQALWMANVIEVNPLYQPENPLTLGRTGLLASPAVFLGLWLWQRRPRRLDARWDANASQVGMLVFGAALYLALTFYQVRWAAYFAVAVSIPWAGVIQNVFDGKALPVLKVATVIAVALTPLIGAWVGSEAGSVLGPEGGEPHHPRARCSWVAAAPALDGLSNQLGRPLVVFAQIHQGPEILYRTRHRVIGTPYHRNARGIGHTAAVFTGANMAETRELLARRAVDVVAICADNVEQRHYLKTPGPTLMRRLVDGNPPNWLKKLDFYMENPPQEGPGPGLLQLWRFRPGNAP